MYSRTMSAEAHAGRGKHVLRIPHTYTSTAAGKGGVWRPGSSDLTTSGRAHLTMCAAEWGVRRAYHGYLPTVRCDALSISLVPAPVGGTAEISRKSTSDSPRGGRGWVVDARAALETPCSGRGRSKLMREAAGGSGCQAGSRRPVRQTSVCGPLRELSDSSCCGGSGGDEGSMVAIRGPEI